MRIALALIAVAACDAASSDPGYGRMLQLPGAQFRPGPFPAATGGPETRVLQTNREHVEVDTVIARLHAVMAPEAHAAIVGILGEDGAWIVVAGPPDSDAPQFPTATANFGLDPGAPLGPFTLLVAATDGDGRIGAPAGHDLVADALPPPDGDLVVSLAWEGAADLDLHVVDPTGGEAWPGHPNTYKEPPPGQPSDPDAYLTGGELDRDKNAGCKRDNSAGEDVIWKTRMGLLGPIAPVIPPGAYTVRVDTHSLCDDGGAAWTVAVYAQGVLLGAASGVSTSEDAITGTHRAGSGVTALAFTR